MFTLIIGKKSVGKKTYVAQYVKEAYPENKVFILDKEGDLSGLMKRAGLRVTQAECDAEIVISKGVKKKVTSNSHYFYITEGDDLSEDLINKARTIIIFPMSNHEKMSDLLEIPVEFLKTLKPFEPIMVI